VAYSAGTQRGKRCEMVHNQLWKEGTQAQEKRGKEEGEVQTRGRGKMKGGKRTKKVVGG